MNPQTPEYVLAKDMQFLSADLFDGSTDISTDDVVLDCTNQRSHSKLASAEFADLLSEFERPMRLPEAIAKYAQKHGQDARVVFEQTIQSLIDLVNAGFLTEAGAEASTANRFQLNDQIAGLTLLQVLRRTEDTEVYLARDTKGMLFCVKTTGPLGLEQAVTQFDLEISIAKNLSGSICPKVISVNTVDDAPVLISEWIDGQTADQWFANLRQKRDGVGIQAAVYQIAQCYARLHSQGVLHGDVRPTNILFDWTGRAWLIDFGLSGLIGNNPRKFSFELSTMEPEAAELLSKELLPALTESGEQYSLAVMLAELIEGSPVRILPSLRSNALCAVANAQPCDVVGFPALSKATMVAPNERYADMESLAHSLRPNPKKFNAASKCESDAYPAISLDASIFYLTKATSMSDADAVMLADSAIRLASENGFASFETASPVHSALGGAVQAVFTSVARADFHSMRYFIDQSIEALQSPPTPAELFTGRAGYLALAARMRDRAASIDEYSNCLTPHIEKLADQVTEDLTEALESYHSGQPTHLGMAHGLAGQCYALLLSGSTPSPILLAALDVIVAHKADTPWGFAWPGTPFATENVARCADYSPSWCSGSAGYLALWLEAEKRIETDFQPLISGAARHAAVHPDRVANLCCGVAGRALILKRHPNWHDAASKLLNVASAKVAPNDTPECSLFRGNLGLSFAKFQSADFPI